RYTATREFGRAWRWQLAQIGAAARRPLDQTFAFEFSKCQPQRRPAHAQKLAELTFARQPVADLELAGRDPGGEDHLHLLMQRHLAGQEPMTISVPVLHGHRWRVSGRILPRS